MPESADTEFIVAGLRAIFLDIVLLLRRILNEFCEDRQIGFQIAINFSDI